MTDCRIINLAACRYGQPASPRDEEPAMTSRPGGTESAVILTLPRSGARAPSRAEIEHGVARGRALQGAAVQAGFRRAFRFLTGGAGLRAPRPSASLPARHHSCC
jgi:hypothetical protein